MLNDEEVQGDLDLCSDTCQSILKKHADDAPVSDFADSEGVVVVVWSAIGIIGNGGFQYLFENTFSGDPNFTYTIEAFRKIKCKEASEILDQVIHMFPNGIIPQNIDLRLKLFEKQPAELTDRLETEFFNCTNDVIKCLANFIRKHLRR
jgi:hypothetical protein